MDVSDLKDDDKIIVCHVLGNMDQDGAQTNTFRMTGKDLKQLVLTNFEAVGGTIIKVNGKDKQVTGSERVQDKWRARIEKNQFKCTHYCVLNGYFGSYIRHYIETLEEI